MRAGAYIPERETNVVNIVHYNYASISSSILCFCTLDLQSESYNCTARKFIRRLFQLTSDLPYEAIFNFPWKEHLEKWNLRRKIRMIGLLERVIMTHLNVSLALVNCLRDDKTYVSGAHFSLIDKNVLQVNLGRTIEWLTLYVTPSDYNNSSKLIKIITKKIWNKKEKKNM